MAGGGPGAASRGRSGKFRKYTRGGGKHFSRDLQPRDADGNEVSMWSEDAVRQLGASDEDEEESEEEESEEESEAEAGGAGPSTTATALSREERKKEKKARKEAAIAKAKKQVQVGDLPPSESEEESEEDDLPANPNHSRQARNQTKPSSVDEAAEGVGKLSVAPSRREREAMEAQAAKERYRKLHEAGKTDEAKADLARLKIIRERREAEAARKQVCCLRFD
ncbi:uncharacterized protein THITE_2117438 [Thermothielavioides terrestris NRRL 8126]|uniref:Casein kinase substrate phosphoprotein PP28 domain-containing protein n=1 Tax=Thermothielavioides terrestris (strain ATCC 38088 / NRRL 8126) TaxID=578455 RepID=G2R822_THETT|nr:uncharacterized protein THITE_2117438 [Thermothielavioides terrestris NRRL 8126]AEO68081.1 hypothetical protein THITE_2117438 [Thermothielavioides terrestris NRRL 8126]